jgi:predicted sulfurtransferase
MLAFKLPLIGSPLRILHLLNMAPQISRKDTSDPISYTCTCSCSETGEEGQILLFYRYYSQPPILTPSHTQNQTPRSLADFHKNLTSTLSIGGKLRIANEGFNITVGGTASVIEAYISRLLSHWSFEGLDLSAKDNRTAFFKPSPGCACAFQGKAKISVKAEITPLGVTNYSPRDWSCVESLEPWEWHERFSQKKEGEGSEKERVLIDVRNHYESRIGYFVDPVAGNETIRPGIRRFSQWPGFASRFFDATSPNPGTIPMREPSSINGDGGHEYPSSKPAKEIYTYCTGGIRCEKGVRWLSEHTAPTSSSAPTKIYTLHGGIFAYLLWLDTQVSIGNLQACDSLFKGRNYVFDGRGSVGLAEGNEEVVSKCHGCGVSESRLSKCRSEGCHLVLVVCKGCDGDGIACCESCREGRSGGMCDCEVERERELWGGDDPVRIGQKKKAKQKGKERKIEGHTPEVPGTEIETGDINIRIKTVD